MRGLFAETAKVPHNCSGVELAVAELDDPSSRKSERGPRLKPFFCARVHSAGLKSSSPLLKQEAPTVLARSVAPEKRTKEQQRRTTRSNAEPKTPLSHEPKAGGTGHPVQNLGRRQTRVKLILLLPG